MTKHGKRRVAVHDNGAYVGVLEDIDLLAFVAGGSQLVGARIDRARDLDDLAQAAGQIERQIRMLRRQGVRIDIVAEIVSDLNRRLISRVFRLTAPRAVADKGCLIVMGSEGRAEQTLRTDQDNGLILVGAGLERRPRRLPRRFHRGAARPGVSALSRRRDGAQSAVVEDGRRPTAPTSPPGRRRRRRIRT